MKIKLDSKTRKFIKFDVEMDSENYSLEYFEKNTKQINALKDLAKDDKTKSYMFEELNTEQFLENLKGDEDVVEKIVDFYKENGNFYDFINMCDKELGKQKKRG